MKMLNTLGKLKIMKMLNTLGKLKAMEMLLFQFLFANKILGSHKISGQ